MDSEVEVKCRGCGSLNTFRGVSQERLLCFKDECPNRVKRETRIEAIEGEDD